MKAGEICQLTPPPCKFGNFGKFRMALFYFSLSGGYENPLKPLWLLSLTKFTNLTKITIFTRNTINNRGGYKSEIERSNARLNTPR